MRRNRPIKKRAEASKSSRGSDSNDECLDLVELMDDRVELLQQAFKSLRTRELQAILPQAMKNRPVTSIKEECLEELLGISSKRLRAILHDTVPPSDTESSSDGQGAISLDSISSDESNLNNIGKSKKKRNKRKESKKRNKKKDRKGRAETPETKRKNFTVLELLELTARARAIRAQLHKEPAPPNQETASGSGAQEASAGEDDDVLIKEEPPVVVELSSDDDEKPDLLALKKSINKTTTKIKKKESSSTSTETCSISKKNDLTIITPKKKISKRIKLKRVKFVPKCLSTKSSAEMSANDNSDVQQQVVELEKSTASNGTPKESIETKEEIPGAISDSPAAAADPNTMGKPKTKKKKRAKALEGKAKDDSDKDEIMLQLSDTEKMDVLEDFYPKKKKLSSNTEDSGLSTSEEEPATEASNIEAKASLMEVEMEKPVVSNTALASNEEMPTVGVQVIPTIEITESENQVPNEPGVGISEMEGQVPNEPNVEISEMEIQVPSEPDVEITDMESQVSNEPAIECVEIESVVPKYLAEGESQGSFEDIKSDDKPAAAADELEPSITSFDVLLEKDSSNESKELQIMEDTKKCEDDTEVIDVINDVPEGGPIDITQVEEDNNAPVTQQVINQAEVSVTENVDEIATPFVLTSPPLKVFSKNKNKKGKKGKKGKK